MCGGGGSGGNGGGWLGSEGAGWAGYGRFSLRGRKKRGRGEWEKKITITDERMRCEEGKMLLLEAFFSNQ